MTDISLRGATAGPGRGQVFLNGRPLCNAAAGNNAPGTWDINAANVVCRMLGFPKASKSFARTCQFGDCTASNWIRSGFQCTGSENDIRDCPHESSVAFDCDAPSVDMVGVECITGEDIFSHGDLLQYQLRFLQRQQLQHLQQQL